MKFSIAELYSQFLVDDSVFLSQRCANHQRETVEKRGERRTAFVDDTSPMWESLLEIIPVQFRQIGRDRLGHLYIAQSISITPFQCNERRTGGNDGISISGQMQTIAQVLSESTVILRRSSHDRRPDINARHPTFEPNLLNGLSEQPRSL